MNLISSKKRYTGTQINCNFIFYSDVIYPSNYYNICNASIECTEIGTYIVDIYSRIIVVRQASKGMSLYKSIHPGLYIE